MDDMDINEAIIDVPDTPDRSSHCTSICHENVDNNHDLPVVQRSENPKCLDEKFMIKPMDRDREVIKNGFSKRSISSKIARIVEHLDDPSFYKSANSSVSMDDHFLGGTASDKAFNDHSIIRQHIDEGRPLCANLCSRFPHENDKNVDITEDMKIENLNQSEVVGASIDLLPEEVKEISLETTDGCSSKMSNKNFKVMGKTSDYPFTVSTVGKDRGKGIFNPCKSHHEEDKSVIPHHHRDPLTRVVGQKILVKKGSPSTYNVAEANHFSARVSDDFKVSDYNETAGIESNGPPCDFDVSKLVSQHRVIKEQRCLSDYGIISPHDICKPNHFVQGFCKCSKCIELNETRNVGLNAPPVFSKSDSVSKNQINNDKGKAVISHPKTSTEYGIITKGLPSRIQIIHEEDAEMTSSSSRGISDDLKGLGGWRSTHNRSKKTHIPASDETKVQSGWNDNNFASQDVKRANKIDSGFVDAISESDQGRGQRHAKKSNIKRQRKQGSVLSQPGTCSTSVFGSPEVVFIDSSGDSPNLRSRRNQKSLHWGSRDQIIEIQESPSEDRQRVDISHRDDNTSNASARQVEADEILARELQEQLYHETPPIGGGHEFDANIAWALQQEENAQQASLNEIQHTLLEEDAQQVSSSGRPRDILFPSHSHRYRFRPNQARRGNLARLPPSNRGRTRNQPLQTAFSSGNSAVPLPEWMDLERRVGVLEAVQAALTDFGRLGASNLTGVQRDFNESDYEMLLALDENIDELRGASVHQINSLPQSTIKIDGLNETCAICLEAPTMGSTIRHLPCVHKFHKDCIDPWLRRRSSCPVCKSSIA